MHVAGRYEGDLLQLESTAGVLDNALLRFGKTEVKWKYRRSRAQRAMHDTILQMLVNFIAHVQSKIRKD